MSMSRIFSNVVKHGGLLPLIFVSILSSGFFSINDSFSKVTECKNIDINAEVLYDKSNRKRGTIVIDYKENDESLFRISIVGPKKFYINDLKEKEVKGLSSGSYSVVIVGKDESLNYCPTHIQVVI